MEAYRGLAILTSNLKQSMDQAFLRRLRFVVDFPFPDFAQRARIWARAFPASTPTRDLDVDALARLNLAGGNIRNIALGAAFLAAEEQSAVGMAHVERAARAEYLKSGRSVAELRLRGSP
jgi:SpoVK/Ycf46/Vps4 family AAA+-type ATPase